MTTPKVPSSGGSYVRSARGDLKRTSKHDPEAKPKEAAPVPAKSNAEKEG